ncbi:MAG: hypothetical protein Q9212_005515 [Teloschistes hypoglaucus]
MQQRSRKNRAGEMVRFPPQQSLTASCGRFTSRITVGPSQTLNLESHILSTGLRSSPEIPANSRASKELDPDKKHHAPPPSSRIKRKITAISRIGHGGAIDRTIMSSVRTRVLTDRIRVDHESLPTAQKARLSPLIVQHSAHTMTIAPTTIEGPRASSRFKGESYSVYWISVDDPPTTRQSLWRISASFVTDYHGAWRLARNSGAVHEVTSAHLQG